MNPKNLTPAHLKKIFKAVENTLFDLSPLPANKLTNNFEKFKNIDSKKINWDKFYELIVFVTFYSGFKAEIVNSKYYSIKKNLGKLNIVAGFKQSDIKAALKNNDIIRHEAKIRACVFNAKKILELKSKCGSFQKYLSSFGDLTENKNLNAFANVLKKNFLYLGGITVNHLLTDLGLNVVKPDRVVCRIFYRLGLINSITDYESAINIGRLIKKATGLPIRYVDLIIVFYGQVGYKAELNIDNGICLKSKPKCDICQLKNYCNYYKLNN